MIFNSTDPDDEERDLTLFSDNEMISLAEDKGDDGLTSFDAAILERSRAFKLNYMTLGHCVTCHLIETILKTMFLLSQNQLPQLTNNTSKPLEKETYGLKF